MSTDAPKRLEWVKEKLQHGLGVDGSLVDELNEQQGHVIASYLDGDGDISSSALIFSLEQVTIMVEETREIPREETQPRGQTEQEAPQEEQIEGEHANDAAPPPEPEPQPEPQPESQPPSPARAGRRPSPNSRHPGSGAGRGGRVSSSGRGGPGRPSGSRDSATSQAALKSPQTSEQQQQQQQQEGGEQQHGAEGEGSEGKTEEEESEPPPPPPPQLVKISVPKLVSRLHLSSGFMPDELSNLQSFYLVRGKPGKLLFEDLDEALECGVLNERPSLRNLEQTIANVYMPMLIQMTGADVSSAGVLLSSGASNSHKDLLSNMQKFLSQVSHALQQLNGDVTLEVPEVPTNSVEKAAADTELVMSLEQYLSEWSSTLASVMQQESERQPIGLGPLAEIEFWRLRNAVLSALYEQLNLPSVRKIIFILEAGSEDRNLMASFKSQLAELTKLAAEARDNVKFLNTLERHFKNIAGGPLNGILDTLPPMMNALRMVWIISRHYSDDQRMGSLFQRIAQEIGDRVESAIDLSQIFRVPPQEALKLIRACKSVLEAWFKSYMDVREKIEQSGRDARWEFPKQLLFARTNYMAEICNDLIMMVEVVDDFFKFLGPELKAVTGDMQGIDRVIQRVKAMYEPIEQVQVTFHPTSLFDIANANEWKAAKAAFQSDNEDIQSATRELIDTSFRKLRSAEGACELLQNFKHIKSKGAIQKQVINKFNDILEQFAREIDQTTTIFEGNKHAPPVTKNQPPIAGAIKWARALLARLKQTMIKLHSTEEEIIRTTEIGCNVESKFRSFAKSIMYYEKKLFSTWSDSINTITMQHLKQPIFTKSSATGRVEVNFHTDLIELIRETRYLDRMGFPIPEIALNVALQEVKYHQWLESLQHMLEHYYEVIEQLSPIEHELMANKLCELESCLHAGFHTLNWNSLGILEFIQACRRAINTFQQVVKQVQKNSGIIEQVVHAITGTAIVTEPPANSDIMDLQEFYEHIEKHRLENTDRLVKKYRNISPLLGKIEEVVAGTNTGKSPQLAGYYAYWERAIFNALNAMVSNAMTRLQSMFDSRSKRVQAAKAKALGEDPNLARARKQAPLFKVSVSLQNMDIVIQPPVNEGGREYLREAKAAAAVLGGVDAMIALVRRVNKRYQDLLSGKRPRLHRLSSMASCKSFHAHVQASMQEDLDDSSAFERDMTTLEAQQDLYFMVFSALLNISVLRSAQPMVAKKGLLVLLGTSTLLYNRVATTQPPCENEAKLLHVVSGITQNLALHPANRTRLYKAELHGSLALDKLIEHAMEGEGSLADTGPDFTASCGLPPVTVPPATLRDRTGAPGTAASQPGPAWKASNMGPHSTSRLSPNSTLSVSVDTALHAQQIRPKVMFPPIVETKEDCWLFRNKGTARSVASRQTTHRTQTRSRVGKEDIGSPSLGSLSQHNEDAGTRQSSMGHASDRMSIMEGPTHMASFGQTDRPTVDSRSRFMSWVDSTFAGEGLEGTSGLSGLFSTTADPAKQTCRKAMWDEKGDWLDVEPESSKLLNKLLCRPLNHLWNDSPEARGRHGQKRWEPAVSEYRESTLGAGMVRSAARLMQTAPPKDESSLMAAATQMMAGGMYDHLAASQQMGEFATDRPSTAARQRGQIALTVLHPNPESLQQSQADLDMQHLAGMDSTHLLSPNTPKKKLRPLKILLGPQRCRQVISFEDRIITDDDSRPTLTLFEHVQGSRVCEGMFPSYQLPNGKMAYMYYNGGLLLDEVAVDPVQPPPRPSTVPQALQQAMPLADVLNLIAKPPGSAPPFIPYKPVPYLVPLPSKHTLPVKAPFKHSASAFGDLRDDNLQLIILAKRIIKTQTKVQVEDIEVKVEEERDPWTLPMSIFKPRLKESDARNFFDTPAALEKMFERDWQRVCSKEKFTSMMAREHKGNKSSDKDETVMLKEVHDVLLEFYQLWYSAFIYFAAGGSGDPYHMSLNAFTTYLDECQVADPESPAIKRSDCDTIFIVCNFQPDKKSQEAQVNVENAMMRYEFLESIVRAGIAKYGRGIATDDVAEAVRMILSNNIAPNLPPAGKHVANDFRNERLYKEEVDLVFKRNQLLLKAIYSRYRLKPPGGGLRTKMLKLEGWNQLMQDTRFLDSHYTIQDSILAFQWSRMFVLDEIKDYARYTSLTFVDFLEALGRCADMKSLPDAADLEEAGYSSILEWAFDKERMEGNPDSTDQGDIFRPRESGSMEAPKTRPLYVKLEQMLDLMFRRLYWDPSNPTLPFNYDGLLKLIKKIDKDMGP